MHRAGSDPDSYLRAIVRPVHGRVFCSPVLGIRFPAPPFSCTSRLARQLEEKTGIRARPAQSIPEGLGPPSSRQLTRLVSTLRRHLPGAFPRSLNRSHSKHS